MVKPDHGSNMDSASASPICSTTRWPRGSRSSMTSGSADASRCARAPSSRPIPSRATSRYHSWYFSGLERKMHDRGLCCHIPMNFGEAPDYYRRFVDVDFAVLKTAPMDEHGFFNFGGSVDLSQGDHRAREDADHRNRRSDALRVRRRERRPYQRCRSRDRRRPERDAGIEKSRPRPRSIRKSPRSSRTKSRMARAFRSASARCRTRCASCSPTHRSRSSACTPRCSSTRWSICTRREK